MTSTLLDPALDPTNDSSDRSEGLNRRKEMFLKAESAITQLGTPRCLLINYDILLYYMHMVLLILLIFCDIYNYKRCYFSICKFSFQFISVLLIICFPFHIIMNIFFPSVSWWILFSCKYTFCTFLLLVFCIITLFLSSGLDGVWKTKPLLDGKGIMGVLQLKSGGPTIGQWVRGFLFLFVYFIYLFVYSSF